MMGIETMKNVSPKTVDRNHSFKEAASGLILRHRKMSG